jgi:hypothetical protein
MSKTLASVCVLAMVACSHEPAPTPTSTLTSTGTPTSTSTGAADTVTTSAGPLVVTAAAFAPDVSTAGVDVRLRDWYAQ